MYGVTDAMLLIKDRIDFGAEVKNDDEDENVSAGIGVDIPNPSSRSAPSHPILRPWNHTAKDAVTHSIRV